MATDVERMYIAPSPFVSEVLRSRGEVLDTNVAALNELARRVGATALPQSVVVGVSYRGLIDGHPDVPRAPRDAPWLLPDINVRLVPNAPPDPAAMAMNLRRTLVRDVRYNPRAVRINTALQIAAGGGVVMMLGAAAYGGVVTELVPPDRLPKLASDAMPWVLNIGGVGGLGLFVTAFGVATLRNAADTGSSLLESRIARYYNLPHPIEVRAVVPGRG